MSKQGHHLSFLVPSLPAQIRSKLVDDLRVETAEEFLGLAATQSHEALADALGVPVTMIDDALRIARANVDPGFLREMEKPAERFATGARLDRRFELPPSLARHLQQG
jgi:hypothetical protein